MREKARERERERERIVNAESGGLRRRKATPYITPRYE